MADTQGGRFSQRLLEAERGEEPQGSGCKWPSGHRAAKNSILGAGPGPPAVCDGSSPSLALSYGKYREEVT